MKVAIVTPYHREPIEVIRRCVEAVRAQDANVVHYLVGDAEPGEVPLLTGLPDPGLVELRPTLETIARIAKQRLTGDDGT